MQRVQLNDTAISRIADQTNNDSLRNLLSGMGTASDKTSAVQYAFTALSRVQLSAAYRSDWIARKVVDIPAFDATREWRTWQLEADDLTDLEDAEKAFGIQRKSMLALQRARLYGGSALVMGVDGQGNNDLPLDPSKVKQGDLKFVHLVNRHDLSSGPIDDDIMSPFYGEPSWYERVSRTAGMARIHPSRVVRFLGAPVPDLDLIPDGWADSILQVVNDAVIGAGLVTSVGAQLVQEAKLDVIKIPNLTEKVTTQAYRDKLKARFALANHAKSVYSMLLLDGAEEWERIEQSFAQLPELLQMYLLIASGAADIPATRMLSQSPAGMNATGESDVRNYYDRISTEQKVIIQPAISPLDQVLVYNQFGSWPDGLFYNWNSLWQMDEAQKADIATKKATTFKGDLDSGLFPPEVLRDARINQLIEDGVYPGLEQILEAYENGELEPMEVEEPDEELIPANENDPPEEEDPQAAMNDRIRSGRKVQRVRLTRLDKDKRKRVKLDRMNDASAPRTMYLRRDVVNSAALIKWAKKQGFKNIKNDLHVTIAYSKAAFDWMNLDEPYRMSSSDKGTIELGPNGIRVVEQMGAGDVVALLFTSRELSWRHRDVLDAGGSTDYEDYQPHITISKAGDAPVDLRNVEPYRGPIILGPEIAEEIDPNKD